MTESQKYSKLVGGHFGRQCVLTLEECPYAAHTWDGKPVCKSCEMTRNLRKVNDFRRTRGSGKFNFWLAFVSSIIDYGRDQNEKDRTGFGL